MRKTQRLEGLSEEQLNLMMQNRKNNGRKKIKGLWGERKKWQDQVFKEHGV